MAQVTIELRNLLKTNFELFDFEYKFDDLNMKKQLEEDVINYYYHYEIGQETPDMFKHTFKSKWLRIIGYYNEIYNTTLLKYDPLINYKLNEYLEQLENVGSEQSSNVTSENKGKSNTNNTQTNNLTNTDKDVTSDYPQQNISTGDYASGSREGESKSTGTVKNEGGVNSEDNTKQNTKMESTQDTTKNYEKTIEGITGHTYQDLIRKERDNIIRISDMVIKELKTCFILTY